MRFAIAESGFNSAIFCCGKAKVVEPKSPKRTTAQTVTISERIVMEENIMSERSDFSAGLGAKVCGAFADAGGTPEELNRLAENFKLVIEILAVQRGDYAIVPKRDVPNIIRVNRAIQPTYPGWMKAVLYPELESAGPAEYDLAKAVELWLHNYQKGGVIEGNCLYQHLKDTGILKTCLGLQDGEEIRKKGVAVFRDIFEDKDVFLWKAVVLDDHNLLRVPYLCENYDEDEVVLRWRYLHLYWNTGHPAARFASN